MIVYLIQIFYTGVVSMVAGSVALLRRGASHITISSYVGLYVGLSTISQIVGGGAGVAAVVVAAVLVHLLYI